MTITTCSLCTVDTAGNHEQNCPSRLQQTIVLGQAAPLQSQQILDACIFTECKGKQLQAELNTAKEDKGRLRPFPLLSEKGICGSIPWWVAEQAYITYAGRYGNEQSLERLAERGGFGISEMDEYFPEWRDECSLIAQLQAELATEKAEGKLHLESLGKLAAYSAGLLEENNRLREVAGHSLALEHHLKYLGPCPEGPQWKKFFVAIDELRKYDKQALEGNSKESD